MQTFSTEFWWQVSTYQSWFRIISLESLGYLLSLFVGKELKIPTWSKKVKSYARNVQWDQNENLQTVPLNSRKYRVERTNIPKRNILIHSFMAGALNSNCLVILFNPFKEDTIYRKSGQTIANWCGDSRPCLSGGFNGIMQLVQGIRWGMSVLFVPTSVKCPLWRWLLSCPGWYHNKAFNWCGLKFR